MRSCLRSDLFSYQSIYLMSAPYQFDDFFASGKEESISPFLTPSSKRWGKNLSLKSAAFSFFLLAVAFTSSFFHETLSALLLVPVYFLVGTPALIDTLEDIKNFEINIDVLMTAAALLSVLIGSGMEGALLLVLFELSAAIENAVTQRTKSALVNLNQLSPRTAHVIGEHGVLIERSVREIAIGTKILVKAGEIIPLDGEVVQGISSVNLAHLTGESHPILKQIGDEVASGALNLDGTLTLSVTRISADSTLHRIINLIAHAQEAKPKLSRLIDRFSKSYATLIMALFFFFALTLPFFASIPYLGTEGGIYRALTFLIAASPCALILATPTAYLSAISACAKKGIILKGGVVLDAIARIKKIAFDKTGTLTTGKLQCLSFARLSGSSYSEELALSIASSLERHAVHPIADALIHFAESKGVAAHPLQNFRATSGSGLEAEVELARGKVRVFIGSREFIREKTSSPILEEWIKHEGKLYTFLLIEESLYVFEFADAVRAQAQETIELLKTRHGLEVLMLTGDHKENAKFIAEKLGIIQVFADLRPEDKLQKVSEFSQKEGLIMVGDGVNDAPALARATVGISLGKIGSATAVDASDVVLLQDDLSLLPWLKTKAEKTVQIVKQNLCLSLGVILLATTPALLGVVPLWIAVLLHEGGTVLVGLNSLRLLRS
jgi:Cd2+/Zn2+-exporting ATPase